MKKKLFLTVLLCALAAFTAACASIDDTSAATVRLTVETAAGTAAGSVTVVSSSGTVEGEGKVFTVSLPDRRGAVVTVSADGYETVTLRFDAADFAAADTIERTVTLADPAEAVLQLSVQNGVPATVTAHGADPDTEYTVVKSGSRHTVTVPRAGLDVTVEVSADGYEPYTMRVTEADLKSGCWYGSVRLVREGYKLVETYGYYETAFTRDYTILSGSRGEYNGQNDDPPVYFELPADSTVMLQKSRESGVTLVRTNDLLAYGTTYGRDTDVYTEALYISNKYYATKPINETHWYCDTAGGLLEPVTAYQTWNASVEENVWYFPLPGACTLYALTPCVIEIDEGYYETGYTVLAYSVSDTVLAESLRNPVYLDDGLRDLTPKLTPAEYDVPVLQVCTDENGAALDDTTSEFYEQYLFVRQEMRLVPHGEDGYALEYTDIYTERLTFRFTFDGYRPAQDYDAVTAGEQDEYYSIGLYATGGSTLTYDESRDVTVLEFTGRFDDGTVYFQLYRFAMLYSEKYGYDSVQVGEEPFCYAADELTREGSTYTYPRTITPHDYVCMDGPGQYYEYFEEFLPGLIAEEYPALADGQLWMINSAYAADGMMTADDKWYFPADAMVTVTATYEGDKDDRGYTVVTAESAPVRAYDFVVAFERLRFGYAEQEMPALDWTFSVSKR